MSRWGELIPHDEDAAEEGRCLCGCCDEQPITVDTLYLDAEHFVLTVEAQPPLKPMARVVPCGPPRRRFPLASPVRPGEEPTT